MLLPGIVSFSFLQLKKSDRIKTWSLQKSSIFPALFVSQLPQLRGQILTPVTLKAKYRGCLNLFKNKKKNVALYVSSCRLSTYTINKTTCKTRMNFTLQIKCHLYYTRSEIQFSLADHIQLKVGFPSRSAVERNCAHSRWKQFRQIKPLQLCYIIL